MYRTKELFKYKDYVIQPYYHSHLEPDEKWGYRKWKGYELLCVNEVGCKCLQEAIIAAMKEIDMGLLCRFCCEKDISYSL